MVISLGYSLLSDDSIYQKTIYLYLEYWKLLYEETIYISLYGPLLPLNRLIKETITLSMSIDVTILSPGFGEPSQYEYLISSHTQ